MSQDSRNLQVSVRGLPFECSDEELKAFFDNNGIESVEIERRNGKASGDGVITFIDEDFVKDALKKNKQMLKHRYIEVFLDDNRDRFERRRGRYNDDREPRRDDRRRDDWGGDRNRERHQPFDGYPQPVQQSQQYSNGPRDPFGGGYSNGPTEYDGKVVRLRGVPFSVSVSDVLDFFSPLDVVRDGVLLPDQRTVVTSGDAFVVFADIESCERAKDRHMQHMGHRYIEVFEATYSELVKFCSKHNLRVPPMTNLQQTISLQQPSHNDQYSIQPQYSAPPYNGPSDPYPSSYSSSSRGPPLPYNGPAIDSYDNRYPPAQPPKPVDEYRYEAKAPVGFYDAYVPPAVYDSYPSSDSRNDPRYSRPDPRIDPRSDPRSDMRGPPRNDPRMDSRYSDYGPPAYEPREVYDSNWRTGSIGSGGGGGPPPSNGFSQHSWDPRDRSVGDRRDLYSSYPGERYDQREAVGGPMRRPDYRRDDRYPPRHDPYSRHHDPYHQQQERGHFVLKMRGIPFRSTENDVVDWFSPARPNRVELLRDGIGRPNGDARVIFHDRKDYDQALLKDKQYMGERYIEMIPDNGRY